MAAGVADFSPANLHAVSVYASDFDLKKNADIDFILLNTIFFITFAFCVLADLA